MLPLTLGANIGTTVTAMIASLVSLKFNAVQIALCHLCFNIFGILIWFPIPIMRRVPLNGARLLGLYASYFRWVPVVYILVAFVLIPLICLGMSALFNASVAGGVVLLLLLLGAFGVFEYFWLIGYPKGNALCYKVLSEEQRLEGKRALEQANAEVMGMYVSDQKTDDQKTVEEPTQEFQV
jgi:sodium-dependent phosphate cotransporter